MRIRNSSAIFAFSFVCLVTQACQVTEPRSARILTEGPSCEYVGEVSHSMPHGNGVQRCLDGAMYVGEWKDGVRHGRGTYTLGHGRVVHRGWWCDDEPSEEPCAK